MELNNKGITLVEIIISVALISIVLVFLFTLLIQVNNENADNELRSSYLVNQSAFTSQIEEDFLEYNLESGETCSVNPTNGETDAFTLYLPRLYEGKLENIKCLKFTYNNPLGEYTYAYLFLYKRTESTLASGDSEFKTILSYYRGDFKQSVELENFEWTDNSSPNCTKCDVVINNDTYKTYSLPIIGPDYNDYSINLSYTE